MRVFGILNVTEDSFSDGGRFLDPDRALCQARALLEAGADVVDVGPASSHPDARPVPPATQIDRLRPILASGIDRQRLSIDCTDPAVQRFAIGAGVGYINDIRGFADPAVYPALADSDVRLIVMHSMARSEIARRVDVPPSRIMGEVFAFLDRRLEALTAAGISADRIVLDPGMGFFLGTDPLTSVEVLARIGELKARYSLPVMVSVSRKSFLQALAGETAEGAAAATLAAELFSVQRGADYVRTHEPKPLRQAIRVWRALEEAGRTRRP